MPQDLDVPTGGRIGSGLDVLSNRGFEQLVSHAISTQLPPDEAAKVIMQSVESAYPLSNDVLTSLLRLLTNKINQTSAATTTVPLAPEYDSFSLTPDENRTDAALCDRGLSGLSELLSRAAGRRLETDHGR